MLDTQNSLKRWLKKSRRAAKRNLFYTTRLRSQELEYFLPSLLEMYNKSRELGIEANLKLLHCIVKSEAVYRNDQFARILNVTGIVA